MKETIIRATSLFQALVAIDHSLLYYRNYKVDSCPDSNFLEGEDHFLYPGNFWWNRSGETNTDTAYQRAIDKKFIKPKMDENERNTFIARQREYDLIEIEKGNSGFLGLNRKPYLFRLVAKEKCPQCGGEYIWQYFSEYKSKSIPDYCMQEKICTGCGFHPMILSSRFTQKHVYQEQFFEPGSCKRVKRCKACGHVIELSYEKHQFSEWYSSEKEPCKYIRTCQRCNKKEYKTEHIGDWTQTGYTELSDGMVLYHYSRTCTRCGTTEERSEPVISPS